MKKTIFPLLLLMSFTLFTPLANADPLSDSVLEGAFTFINTTTKNADFSVSCRGRASGSCEKWGRKTAQRFRSNCSGEPIDINKMLSPGGITTYEICWIPNAQYTYRVWLNGEEVKECRGEARIGKTNPQLIVRKSPSGKYVCDVS